MAVFVSVLTGPCVVDSAEAASGWEDEEDGRSAGRSLEGRLDISTGVGEGSSSC